MFILVTHTELTSSNIRMGHTRLSCKQALELRGGGGGWGMARVEGGRHSFSPLHSPNPWAWELAHRLYISSSEYFIHIDFQSDPTSVFNSTVSIILNGNQKLDDWYSNSAGCQAYPAMNPINVIYIKKCASHNLWHLVIKPKLKISLQTN